jgi:xylan 1,4-beta-xylosidase
MRQSVQTVIVSAVIGVVAACSCQTRAVPSTPPPSFPVTITIDAAKPTGDLNPIWRWCGYDEPNYTYAPNGKKLIAQFTGEKNSPFGPASFRTHSLLVTGDGTPHLKWGSTNAYTEDDQGRPTYDWTILDKIFDTYLDAGGKPYAQIGFMPKALSLKPDPYEHHWKPGDPYSNIYTGWTTPPKDYNKWRELCYQWARHCVERYGMAKVKTWNWEVWNEANIAYLVPSTPGGNKVVDYEKIWDYAADGIRKAIPDAIIGGAETAGAGGNFQREFIEHCINGTNFATGNKGSPLGLISFHAKGAPANFRQAGHVRMGIANQLATIKDGFRIATARPETAKLAVVIGESDPDGCAACQSYNGLYPEFGYRNSSLFAAYTIEQLTRTLDLADRMNVHLLGAVTWAFEFEDEPIFGGFRALATDGVALPVLNTFRMLNKMGMKRLAVTSTGDVGLEAICSRGVRGDPDVHALASRDERRVTIVSWNYHDDDLPGPTAHITLNISGLPADLVKVRMTEWRVDDTHSNAYTAWKAMGSPVKPTAEQHRQLEAASELSVSQSPTDLPIAGGHATVKLDLPRQAVSLIELAW